VALGEVRLPALEQILDGRERRAEVGIPWDHVLDDGVPAERGLAPRGLRRDRVEALGLNSRSRRSRSSGGIRPARWSDRTREVAAGSSHPPDPHIVHAPGEET